MQNKKNLIWSLFLTTVLLSSTISIGLPFGQAEVIDNNPSSLQLPGLSSSFSRGIQGILGINHLTAWVASRQIKKEIRKKVAGKLYVKVKPYSGVDLMGGKARRLDIEGENLVYDEAFYVSRFELHTDEDTPLWIDLDSGNIKKPVDADITIHLKDTDLNRSFQTKSLKKQLSNIKVPLLGFGSQTVQLIEPKVIFYNDKLGFNTLLGVKGVSREKALPLEIETGLETETSKGTLRFKDLKIMPISGIVNLEPIENILEKTFHNVLNPAKLMPIENTKLEIRSIQLSTEGLFLEGHIKLSPKGHIEKLTGIR